VIRCFLGDLARIGEFGPLCASKRPAAADANPYELLRAGLRPNYCKGSHVSGLQRNEGKGATMIVSTRSIQHSDGRLEIARTFLQSPVTSAGHNDPLAYEDSILWLLAPDALDYVRVTTVHQAITPRGPLATGHEVVLAGYAKLLPNAPPDAKTGLFSRRVFYLLPEDSYRNLNDVPKGAIDPLTVFPGKPGTAPDIRQIDAAYPRHLRRKRRRSFLRNPVSIARILAKHRRVATVLKP
jgi:hypothetical protein